MNTPQTLTLELTTADGAAFPLSIPNEGVILYEKNHKLAVLLLALWLRADRPRLNAQSLLNRLERANLAEESRLLNTRFVILAGYNGSLQYEEYLAAGVTDTHLHLARLWKRSLLWYQARLTAGDVTLTASGPCAEGGFTLFDFGDATPVQAGYDALEVTLLDADGNPLTTARRTFA